MDFGAVLQLCTMAFVCAKEFACGFWVGKTAARAGKDLKSVAARQLRAARGAKARGRRGVFQHNVRRGYVNKIMLRGRKTCGKVLVDKNVDNVKNFAAQGEFHISTSLSTTEFHSLLRAKSYILITKAEITSTAQPDYCQLFSEKHR